MAAEVKKEIELEIAHVLFVDIVAYSKMATDDQRAAIDKLNQIVQSTDEFRKAESEKRLLKIATGDGMALIFYHSPEDPVECALEVSRALREQHPELRLRMGVHSGPVNGVVDVNGRANVAGAGINIAQRVMDCGDAGHILVSKRVAEDLEQFKHWRPHLYHLGECEVKHGEKIDIINLFTAELGNPERPQRIIKSVPKSDAVRVARERAPSRKPVLIIVACVAIAALVSGIFLFWQRQKPKTFIPEKSIAVLPFENLSEDKANAYFADGIQDEILTRLSKIADLKVISRTSTQHYKSAPENLPEIARLLGVAHILEGSVQKSSDAVRVNVQLIKAANDSHLWADTFDRKLTDIFSVESEVAKAIAEQLRAKLTGREEQEITSKPTNNPQAYDTYLRGLAYTHVAADTPATVLGAQKYFREAVRLDPKFALGWAKLSYSDSFLYLSNISPTPALREEARQAADTALDLQPGLGEALLAKGYYHYWCLKDYDTAIRYFEQAARVLPNSSEIPAALAYVARRGGNWEKSEAYFNEAEQLDPQSVDLLGQHVNLYLSLRRFQEAARKINQILTIVPNDPDMVSAKASIAQAEGDLPRAAALLRPLRPTAAETSVLETQIYQAVLERHPAEMIPRLKEILASPDPALGHINGELRMYLGWLQRLAGDNAAAQASWRQAHTELEALLPQQPDNFSLFGGLALTAAGQGDKTAALAFAERCIALLPIERDAVIGPGQLEVLARVCSQVGQPDRAIAALQKLLSIPYGGSLANNVPLTPALLRLDPMFDLLRNDPRFQKLVASPAPKN
jgi:TolB-like protein/class 3 adenylate cyclase/Tfp pilus assembly protein PilF